MMSGVYDEMSIKLRSEEARGNILILMEAAELFDELRYKLCLAERNNMNKWISVKDKMPKSEEPVLVRYKIDKRPDAVGIGFYESGNTTYEGSRYAFDDSNPRLIYDSRINDSIITEGWYEPRFFPDIFEEEPAFIDLEVTHWMPFPSTK